MEKNYKINKTWKGDSVEEKDELRLKIGEKRKFINGIPLPGIQIEIICPLYNKNEIQGSNSKIGRVENLPLESNQFVQLILLGFAERYLTVTLDPFENYLLQFYEGRKNMIKSDFTLEYYKTKISEDKKTWKGFAFIPADFLPLGLQKFNIFALHKIESESGSKKIYMALFSDPQSTEEEDAEEPDFCNFEHFQNIDFF